MSWVKAEDEARFRRADGAEVWFPPESAGRADGRVWVGCGPDRGAHLRRKPRCDRTEAYTPLRRFGSARSAMAAVDAAYPLQGRLPF